MTATSHASFSVKRPPKKPTNAERRSRDYLTAHEADHVITAARKAGRHSCRDGVLILLMYRHGLRVAEAVSLGHRYPCHPAVPGTLQYATHRALYGIDPASVYPVLGGLTRT
jgi:hypothetical protein